MNGCKKPLRLAFFISGGGSTLQALLELQHQLDVKLVVSSKQDAKGLQKARRFGCPVTIVDKKIDFEKLDKTLKAHKIEMIFLLGFMKILPETFVSRWSKRILNIHPSLLPLYPGLKSAERSWKDGATMGATIHEVTAEVDAGSIVVQQSSHSSQLLPISWEEAHLLLRRTEQNLLREVALRFM